jgi:hypothetical protein
LHVCIFLYFFMGGMFWLFIVGLFCYIYLLFDSSIYIFGWSAFLWIRFFDTLDVIFFKWTSSSTLQVNHLDDLHLNQLANLLRNHQNDLTVNHPVSLQDNLQVSPQVPQVNHQCSHQDRYIHIHIYINICIYIYTYICIYITHKSYGSTIQTGTYIYTYI